MILIDIRGLVETGAVIAHEICMSSEAQRSAFHRTIDQLRSGPGGIEPAQVAQIARSAGLSPDETLFEVGKYERYGAKQQSDASKALTQFACALCEGKRAHRILEFGLWQPLLTASLAESSQPSRLVYLAPYPHVASLLKAVFHNTVASVVESAAALGAAFDVIVCSPPLGQTAPGEHGKGDGFGGEIVHELASLLADKGLLCWVTGRGALVRAKQTLTGLEGRGLHVAAVVDIPPGGFPGTMIEGVIIVFRHKRSERRFVGALRDLEASEAMAAALLEGPSRKNGASWTWLAAEDRRTYSEIEHAWLMEKLKPRGRYALSPLVSLLMRETAEKADKPLPVGDQVTSFLFVPEYAGSRVTVDLGEQTVKLRAVYRLMVDPAKANPHFLARLLNSAYGRQLRLDIATGATIQRLSARSLLELELPIPNRETQDRIVRFDSDVGLVNAALRDAQQALDGSWAGLAEISEKIEALKSVLDIERQIADWWRELPYPLATIYRRYQVSRNPKDRLDTLLQFFEMAAIYLAAMGASYVKALRANWQEIVAKWLHPPGAAGIERADFGFWVGLSGASLKDLGRITSDKELRASAINLAGPELPQAASIISQLGKATEVLDVARRHRNSWKGHGGHIKASDATRLERELQQLVRDFYEICGSVFRRIQLMRPGMAEISDSGFKFQVENLSGSDPTFATEIVELDRPSKSNSLAFWLRNSRMMCNALPFFRLGAPQEPQETSFYVFNRIEKDGFRWISYQEAREQEFIANDDELLRIIALGSSEMLS